MANLFPTRSRLINDGGLIPVDFYSIDNKETDADSFFVKDKGGNTVQVRLTGIDAPEIAHGSGKRSQLYGSHSTEIMRNIVKSSASGTNLLIKPTGNESHGRVVAEAFIRNRNGELISLNQELVRQKAAYLMSGKYGDPAVATPELKSVYNKYLAEAVAGRGTGIFSPDAAMPEEFRHKDAKLFGVIDVSPIKIGEGAYNTLANLGLVERLTSVAQADGGKAAAAALGYHNPQLAPFFGGEGGGTQYLLSSRHGASHFYEIALFNAARSNGGLTNIDPTNMEGYASAAYKLKYAAAHEGMSPNELPWYVKQYDREMNDPGLGFYMNQWAAENGYGRLYKDELGALPSIAGAIGAILDRSFNYYGSNVPDWVANRENVDPGASYREPKAGFFQNFMGQGTGFALTTASAVLTYFVMGVPYGYVTSEIFKMSMQGLLDVALGQGVEAHPLMRNAAMGAVLGPEYIGMPLHDTKNAQGVMQEGLLNRLKGQANSEGIVDFYTEMASIPGANNILQRRRAGILFDNIVQPFISDIVNPYAPTINGVVNEKWLNMRNAMDAFGEEMRKPIALKIEEGGSRVVIHNAGFERAKSVARQLDNLAMLLPANPLNWGWGKNYSNPDPNSMLSLGEIFSFSDLMENLDRIYFQHGFDQVFAKSQIIDETSVTGRMGGKVQTAFLIPWNIAKEGVARLQGNASLLGPVLGEHRKLRNLQSQLIESGMLQWDGPMNMRSINLTSEEDLHAFLNQVVSYQGKVTADLSTESKLVSKATKYFEEQKFRINFIKSNSGKLVADPLIKGRGMLAEIALGGLVFGSILNEFMSSTSGASLFSQVALALNHNQAAAPEFTPTYLFSITGNRMADAAITTVGALAGGWAIGTVAQGAQLERYTISAPVEEAVRRWADGRSAKLAGKALEGVALANEVLSTLKGKGLVTLKGNFFKGFLWGTFGIMALGKGLTWAGAGALNVLRNIPFLGEKVLGNGKVTPNENLMLVTQLSEFRGEVLRRMRSGEGASSLEMAAAYQAGTLARTTSFVDAKGFAGDVRVIAKQAPLPFFQFFMAETIKGRTFNEAGEMQKRGIVYYSAGMQTAPVLGTNLTFGLPVGINWDAKNKLGVSLVYNDNQDNVINYMNALATLGLTASMSAALSMTALEGTAVAVGLFNKEAADDLRAAANTVKTTAKSFGRFVDNLVRLPQQGFNSIDGVLRADADGYLRATKSLLGPGKQNKWLRLIRGGLSAYLGYQAAGLMANFFTEDSRVSMATALVGAGAAFAASWYQESIHEGILKVWKSSTISKVVKGIDNHILAKVNRKWALPAAAFAMTGLAMTSSDFGIAVGMDENLTERLQTIGIYTAIGSAALASVNDLGRSASDTMHLYRKMKVAAAKEASNPLAWAKKNFAEWRVGHLEYDLDQFTTGAREFIKISYSRSSTNNTAKEITEGLRSADGLKNYAEIVNNHVKEELSEVVTKKTYREAMEAVFERPEFTRFMKGRGPGFARMRRGYTAVFGAAALTGVAVQAIGQALGGWGQEGVNRYYEAVEGIPLIGNAIANVTRLLTGKDKVTYDRSVDYFKEIIEGAQGKNLNKIGAKLIRPNDPQAIRLQNIITNLLSPMSINSMNAYQQVLPGVGITLRPGEYGEVSRFSSYFQVQSAGQDISSAVYSLAPSTLMKAATQGKGELALLVQNAVQRITGGAPMSSLSPGQMRLLANAVLGSTASMSSLDSKHRRKFSSPASDSEASLIGSDPILGLALRERMRRSSELANQRLESIISRMADPNDPSMLMGVDNIVNPDNPLAGINRAADGSDLALIGGHAGVKGLLNHIFNPFGHINIKNLSFRLDRKTQEMRTNTLQMQDTSEWVQYASMYLDQSETEEPTAANIFTKVFQNFDQLISPFGGPAKFAIYAALTLATAAPVLGFASTFMFRNETAAVLNSLELPRTLFDTASKKYQYTFAVSKNPIEAASHTRNRLNITRGTARFTVVIPDAVEGVNLEQFGKQVVNELNNIQGSIKTITQELEAAVFGVPDRVGIDALNRPDLIKSLDFEYSQLFDKYVDDLFDQFTKQTLEGSGATFLDITGHSPLELEQLKYTVKTSTKEQIKEMLKQEISPKEGRLLKRYNLRSEKEAVNYLGFLIHNYTAGLFHQLKDRLLILSPDDITSVAKMEQQLNEVIRERGGKTVGSQELYDRVFRGRSGSANVLDESVETGAVRGTEYLNPSEFKGRTRVGGVLRGIGGGLLHGWVIASSMFESLDIYSSYTRLAAAADDPSITDAQTGLVAQHAGSVTTNSLIGIGIGHMISKVPNLFKKINFSKLSASKWGLITAGVLAGVGLVAAFGKNIQETAAAVWNSKPVQTVTDFLGTAYEKVSSGIGSLVTGTASVASKLTGGLLSKGAVISAIGGALTGLSLVLAAGAIVSLGATAGAVALTLGGAAAVGGIIGLGLGMIPGYNQFMGKLMSQFTEGLAKVPFIGGIFATSMDNVFEFKGNRFFEPGSPIVTATAQQAIAQDSQRYLLSASDPTGSKSKHLFINPTLYGDKYGDLDPSAQLFNVRPKSLVTPLIDRELSIKGQYYNQSVIGQTMWAKMIRGAENYKELKQLRDAQARANPQAQIQAKRIEGQQQKEVEQLQKNIAAQAKGKKIDQGQVNLAAATFNAAVNFLSHPGESVKRTVVVGKAPFNPHLQQQKENLLLTTGTSPVLVTQMQVNKEGGTATVNEQVSPKNDMWTAITRGLVNPVRIMQQGFT